MLAGRDRCPRGRREGAARGRGRRPRERGLWQRCPRSARPRDERAEAGDRRWRARRVGGLRNVFRHAEQRCWVTRPRTSSMRSRSGSARAQTLLHEMAEAPTRADARKALERFRDEFDAKSRRRSRSSTRTGTRSPRSPTSPPNTGGTCARRIRSRAASRPSSCAPRSPGRRLQEGRARDGLQAARRRPGALAALQRPRARRRRARGAKFKDGIRSRTTTTTTTDEKVAA